ncbi:hypothetical protein [Geomonas oryzae]|uniref:hypothetical protein n=1 Tax=Geomonas oryzae TaxID=2364273 RepID=UPI00100A76A1|nr:hypothetical protein [Geomonas oryzae]
MKYFPVAATVLMLLVALGCNRAEGVVGTWANPQLPETVQFKADHTGVFVVKDLPSLQFTWQDDKNGTVRLDVAIRGTVKSLYGKLDNGAFVIAGNGQRAVYRRQDDRKG